MSSNVVKCVNCNVVINELLAFVNNKMSVMDDESIIRICVSAFSERDIVTVKDLLFDSLPTKKRKIVRKKDSKSLKDIDDIICLLRDADSEDIPVFVARDLEKLPPVLFDHVDVTRLLKDIVKMQHDINMVKKEYATMEQLDLLKSEVETLKRTSIVNHYGRNVNQIRGACLLDSFECHSGPMGLPSMNKENEQHDLSLRETIYRDMEQKFSSSEGSHSSPQPVENTRRKTETVTMIHPAQLSAPPTPPIDTINRSDKTARHTVAPFGSDLANLKTKSMAEIAGEGEWKPQAQNEEWIRVQRKRTRNRFAGNRGKAILEPGNNFRAAEIKVPIYIYNVAKGIPLCDITTYIKKKANIDVNVEKMNMKITKDYESYKIFVPKHKLDQFMSDDFWPEGVAYRRFIEFKYREKGSALNTGATHKNT